MTDNSFKNNGERGYEPRKPIPVIEIPPRPNLPCLPSGLSYPYFFNDEGSYSPLRLNLDDPESFR